MQLQGQTCAFLSVVRYVSLIGGLSLQLNNVNALSIRTKQIENKWTNT